MFGKKNSDDDFHKERMKEEYERQKNINLARGVGGFFSTLYSKVFIYMLTYLSISLLLQKIINIELDYITIISMISAFFVFKLTYVKLYPWKSFFTLVFLVFLIQVAFPENS